MISLSLAGVSTVSLHTDSDEPPAASMFSRSTKRQKQPDTRDTVVNGMMSIVNTLCQAVTNKQDCHGKTPTSASSKKAELRSTYMKQLSDLRHLYDSDILNPHEYEEQRVHIVSLMRELQ